jgi:hypothetical protein
MPAKLTSRVNGMSSPCTETQLFQQERGDLTCEKQKENHPWIGFREIVQEMPRILMGKSIVSGQKIPWNQSTEKIISTFRKL